MPDKDSKSDLIKMNKKIAIMSDTHNNIPNIKKALTHINKEKINIIIHCGDLSAPSVISDIIAPVFKGEIHLVFGNVDDADLLQETVKKISLKRKNIRIYGNCGEIIFDGKRIGFCHLPKDAKKLAETGIFDIIFYGHTHMPWVEKITIQNSNPKIVQLVNPGTLAGIFNKATFAIYDTKTGKLELKILEKL